MVKNDISNALLATIKELGLADVPIKLEHPSDSTHGDYSSNIALIAAKKLKKNPMLLAEEIRNKLLATSNWPASQRGEQLAIEKIEVAPPGFINFWLSKEYLIGNLEELLENKPVTTGQFAGKKIMVEFTDPNPFKEFHIGHLYSNIVGESISRLLEANGGAVRRVNYQGDVGLHVAKSLYGLLATSNLQLAKPAARSQQLEALEKKPLEERIKVLGQAYAAGAKAYEEDEKAKEEIHLINKQVYEKDPAIKELYEQGRKWSLAYFETIYKRLGTKFEGYYFESEVGKLGVEIVKEYLKKGVFEESEGAVIFPGEKYGLHNRVFINSLGLPTYEAKELGLAPKKYANFPYDLSIIITGNEIVGYFKVLLKALEQIRPDLAAKTRHIAHGMVRLPEGKMSSRTGNIITGELLLDQAKERIKHAFKDVDEDVADIIAVGAVKYALLKSGIGKDIAFDFDESISLEGNSGPYLQYTYVRTQSVLGKSKHVILSNAKDLKDSSATPQNDNLNEEEVALLRLLHHFPEVVEEAAQNFTPNALCTYLFELAQAFNLFYQKHKIIGGKQEAFRLRLTSSVGNVLKNGLHLLGIQAPGKM